MLDLQIQMFETEVKIRHKFYFLSLKILKYFLFKGQDWDPQYVIN